MTKTPVTRLTCAVLIAAAFALTGTNTAGIGVDNVDVPAAMQRGIVVVNTPEGNNVTTAEHALALLVSLARHVPQATASMKAGKWEKTRFSGTELWNRTLGVIGLGNIGRIVADRARGLGMQVIAADPYTSPEVAAKLDVELVSLDELFARADAITVHVPKTKETTKLLGRDAFAKMKKGVLVVNAARGGIVDEAALLEALGSGQVAGAALDVFEQEPPPKDHPLLMNIAPIKTTRDYDRTLQRIEQLMDAKPGTKHGDELDVFTTLVKAYEAKHHVIYPPTPVEAIKFRMDQLGMTRKDLEAMLGGRGGFRKFSPRSAAYLLK